MSENTNNKLSKEQVFTRALMFSICKSAIARTIKNTTNKTDRIIYNSLDKAIAKHNADKQEEA